MNISIPRHNGVDFVYNTQLCADIFDDNGVMRVDVVNALKIVADDFIEYIGKMGPVGTAVLVSDILIHGGICNYYYDARSDIDMVIILDLSGARKKIPNIDIGALIDGWWRAWKTRVAFNVCGRKIDMELSDKSDLSGQTDRHGGIYSVKQNAWISRPVRMSDDAVRAMMPAARRYLRKMRAMHRRIVRRGYDNQMIDLYLGHLRRMRTFYFVHHGALTPMTIAFRMFRRAGLWRDLVQRASVRNFMLGGDV